VTHPAWRELLPDAVLTGNALPWSAAAAIDHLGDPDGERVALWQGAPVLLPRTAMGHLRLTGADRISFAQGLLSHDVAALAVDAAVDALLLDHRGQPRAGLSVTRRADDLFLAVDDGAGPLLAQVLREHVIFDQVEVADVGDRLLSATAIADDAALSALAEALSPSGGASAATAFATGASALHLPTPGGRMLWRIRPFGPGRAVDLHLLASDLPVLGPRALAWGRPIGERAFTAARVAYAVATARGEGRLGLPQETGLTARVARRKGCYLGQEIMARVEARGNLRRSLARVRFAGPLPALGVAEGWAVHDAQGARLGAIGSAAPTPDGASWWALALLRRDGDPTGGVVVADPPPARLPAAPVAVIGCEFVAGSI
jgi:tRNA-modifying protein YgfZ